MLLQVLFPVCCFTIAYVCCRRWVMSGTPTPSTPTSHVAHLHPLLAFLQQQPYGSHRKTWEVKP